MADDVLRKGGYDRVTMDEMSGVYLLTLLALPTVLALPPLTPT